MLSLLLLLVENRDRMVGKDELIDKIWDGRIVSESAVSARIKAARKAVGDDGSVQGVIRTIHGKGFRFVADTAALRDRAGKVAQGRAAEPCVPATSDDSHVANLRTARDGRPSIAVLPFQLLGEPGPHAIVADALPADIINDLARLQWLFVIARGSSFRFRGPDVDPRIAGRDLGVRYCLSGTLELTGHAVTISVTLVDATSGGTIWGEQFRGSLDEMQQLRPEIETHVVASLEVQIPQNEVRLARGRPASDLDAWSSFHLGIDHMFRFTREDNNLAARLFTQSLDRDPWFSRALGGLSFTHFQNAFLRFEDDREVEMEAARTLAHRAVETDRLDPFGYFNIGRCFWLEGHLDEAMAWFDQATGLSPSFAQGIYNRGLVGMMAGKAKEADADLALALDLSPFDPLAYAMVSGRALTHLQFGEHEKSADFGVKAAMMPGAHKHIALIAALTSHLAGIDADAQTWLARAKGEDPALKADEFFASFPFAHTAAREVIEKGLRDLNL
ncbi:winged helix-turn-helix domain-containing tetratricopeptide repeat protein [Croceicoccus ponticola]|uniref:winged helix-turn-helix domain-containing tetratricopeptide repeat protein n=1 Tax=Croceicoccus ponticola TaxID=2217664 RepID=UPI0013E3168F|nr:winged helix-turn-helix domain-containing protein [Croceicoccus ponticola]